MRLFTRNMESLVIIDFFPRTDTKFQQIKTNFFYFIIYKDKKEKYSTKK
jgi:hypothetical protein